MTHRITGTTFKTSSMERRSEPFRNTNLIIGLSRPQKTCYSCCAASRFQTLFIFCWYISLCRFGALCTCSNTVDPAVCVMCVFHILPCHRLAPHTSTRSDRVIRTHKPAQSDPQLLFSVSEPSPVCESAVQFRGLWVITAGTAGLDYAKCHQMQLFILIFLAFCVWHTCVLRRTASFPGILSSTALWVNTRTRAHRDPRLFLYWPLLEKVK